MPSDVFQDPQKFPDIPGKFVSALDDFPIETPKGIQMFQVGKGFVLCMHLDKTCIVYVCLYFQ